MTSDSQLPQDVFAALKRDRAILKGRIGLKIRGGVVTFAGQVILWPERNEAIDSAWCAPGVQRVNDQLTIAA